MFDEPLSMKIVLLVTAAFAILAGSLFFTVRGRGVDVDDLGTVDMNNERRRNMIEVEAKRWPQ